MKREYETGANRNPSKGKFQYKNFINPINDYSFAKYMHSKRLLEDGTYRDGDNWQKGLDMDDMVDSLARHMEEFKLLHLGLHVVHVLDKEGEHMHIFYTQEDMHNFLKTLDKNKRGKQVDIEDVLNAIRFNTEAYKLQILGYKKNA